MNMITISCKNFPYLRCPDRHLFSDISHKFDPSKAYVDVRPTYLHKGEIPGLGNWHYDSYDGSPENCGRNFLWVSGNSLTEFEDGSFIKPKEWKEYGAVMHRASPSI